MRPWRRVPPSTGRIANATPPQIDHVASVTMNGCRPLNAISEPVRALRSQHASATNAEQLENHQAAARIEMRGEQCGDQADNAADREVDPACEHHERLAEGDESERDDQREARVDRAGPVIRPGSSA